MRVLVNLNLINVGTFDISWAFSAPSWLVPIYFGMIINIYWVNQMVSRIYGEISSSHHDFRDMILTCLYFELAVGKRGFNVQY